VRSHEDDHKPYSVTCTAKGVVGDMPIASFKEEEEDDER
jgi:hypothetical protein